MISSIPVVCQYNRKKSTQQKSKFIFKAQKQPWSDFFVFIIHFSMISLSEFFIKIIITETQRMIT